MKNVLITGGAGFIGSNLVKHMVKKYSNYNIINLDNLTYAGNLNNLTEIEGCKNYKFIKADIIDSNRVDDIFKTHKIDLVIHLAAESHVDRSISNPLQFLNTNIIGTVNLLNSFRKSSEQGFENKLFYHVSTDEVFGSLGKEGLFNEKSRYDPRSPYSASKASSDHFVRAYGETYGIPYIISNCSNNYGPYQYPEKLIPLFINNILKKIELPIYGDGNYIRDWLYVEDHIHAIDQIVHSNQSMITYNIGGSNEKTNLELVQKLCELMDEKLNRKGFSSSSLIKFVKDRPGHDRRYAIDASKIKNELGWVPKTSFDDGLKITIDWYLNNQTWLENLQKLGQ